MIQHPDHAPLRDLLLEAGKIALARRGDAVASFKDDGSPVTQVDKDLDRFIAEGLTKAFPGCGLRGEEGAHAEGPQTFYIDPIDGTHAYLQGLAYWGPAVCKVVDGELVSGAFYIPDLDQFYFAAKGAGAWCNGRRLTLLPPTAPPGRQVLFAPSRAHRLPGAFWPGKIRVLGSTAAHLALVAGGAGVATLLPTWSLWDVGCGILLILEAGGEVQKSDGTAIDVVGEEGAPMMAGSPGALLALRRGLEAGRESHATKG